MAAPNSAFEQTTIPPAVPLYALVSEDWKTDKAALAAVS